MMNWENYTKDRLIAHHPSGFSIIKQKSTGRFIPLFCEVCGFLMNSHYDVVSYEDYSCCEKCADVWARKRKQEWLSGWRPEEEEVKEEVNKRKFCIIKTGVL